MTMSLGNRMLDLPSFENYSRQQPKCFIFSCPEKACVQNQAWVEVLHFSLLSRLLNIQTTFIFLLHMLVRSLPFPSLTSESFSPRDLQLCYKGHHLFPLQKESVRFVNHSYGNDSVHALCFTSKRDDQLRNSECGQLLRSIQMLVVDPMVIKNNINFRETWWCCWWCTMTDRVISLRSDEKSWEILRKKKSWPTVPNEPRD